jgi:hypothetical protein
MRGNRSATNDLRRLDGSTVNARSRSAMLSGAKLDGVQKLFVFLMAAAGVLVLAMAGATTVRALGLLLLGARAEGVVLRQEVEEGFVSEEVRERDARGDLKTVLRPMSHISGPQKLRLDGILAAHEGWRQASSRHPARGRPAYG